MTVARRIYVNPANPDQRYVLFSNGFIQPLGTALPVAQEEGSINNYNATKAPTFNSGEAGVGDCAVALAIIDWAIPAGYTLTFYGHVWAWGGVAVVPGAPTGPLTGVAEYLIGTNGGFSSPLYGFDSDFVMDPAGNGKGYVLQYDGQVLGFGTGVIGVSSSNYLAGTTVGVRLVMDWATKAYWVLDKLGRIIGRNGATTPNIGSAASWGGVQPGYPNFVWGRGGALDNGPGFVLYDKSSASPDGWTNDNFGRVYPVGAALEPSGFPFNPASAIWIDLAIVDDGQGANPLRLVLLNRQGTSFEYVVSTPPTVAVVEPISPTTTTTRPWVRWSYIDTEGDAQASYTVRVFTAAQYGAGGFNPATSTPVWESGGTNPNTREAQIGLDLANGTYRAYVRATDTSGLSSTWAYATWTQTVTAPATPTVTPTVVAATDSISLALHVNPSGLSASARLAVQYHDADWDGTTWELVRGGYNLTPDGSGNVTALDREARFGIARTYRAITYIYDSSADTWVASAWSATGVATLTDQTHWSLTNPYNSAMGGRIEPDESIVTPVRKIVAGVFQPVGRDDPIIVSDGKPKAPAFSLAIWRLTTAERLAIDALLDADVVMQLRDPLGRSWFVHAVGEYGLKTDHTAGARTDETHLATVQLQTVRRPSAAPLVGPLAGS